MTTHITYEHIHRPAEYWRWKQTGSGRGVLFWEEKISRPKLLSAAISKLYGRDIVAIDCGYLIAGG